MDSLALIEWNKATAKPFEKMVEEWACKPDSVLDKYNSSSGDHFSGT